MARIERPGADEFAPYYGTYIDKVEGDDILDILARQGRATATLLRAVPGERETHRYAPGKWSVREVVAHLVDTEHLFTYRALSFARGDLGPLPGMEQEQWNDEGGAASVPLEALTKEMEAVRASTIALFRRMPEAALGRRGVASGVEFTVRAFPWVIAGHELHHRSVLEARYGLGSGGG